MKSIYVIILGGNNLYFMNQKLKQIVEQNRETLEVCHLGAHFASTINLRKCIKYKLKSDALWLLQGIMSEKRVVNIGTSDLIKLLSSEAATDHAVELSTLSQSVHNQLIDKGYGVVILHVTELDISFTAFANDQKIVIFAKQEVRQSLLDLIDLWFQDLK